ncbi:MAG: DUF2125 domain-containing protein [Acetobacteraceae bacterium]|nr:DUF2125 domain-containing protein [Acetobacteraceae bacterium]
MLKRILALLLTLAVLAGGGAILAFHIATSRLEAGWRDWAERRRAEGWTIQHMTPERGPYGLEAALRLPGLNLSAPRGAMPGGFGFRAEELELTLSPSDLKGVTLRPQGEQALTLGGVQLPLRTQELTARIALDGSAARLDGTTLRLGQDQPLTIASLAFSQTGENLQLTADRLSHAALPLVLRGFGNTIQTLRADLRAQPASIELRQVELRWGALAAQLSGTLTPDDRRQPSGRLTLRLRGADELLNSLAQTGLVPQSGITAARLVVRMSARDPGDGQGPMVELPAEIRGGALTIARIPIARLPPLEWR